MSEETRYDIIKLLSSSTRFLTINDIAERLNKDKKTIDKHVRILLENGLVERKYIEEERSYGYGITRLCSNLLIAIDKAISLEGSYELEIPLNTKKELTIKKKFSIPNLILPVLFLILAIIIGYGDKLGLYGPTSYSMTIARVLGFIVFIVLALFFLYITIKGKLR